MRGAIESKTEGIVAHGSTCTVLYIGSGGQ